MAGTRSSTAIITNSPSNDLAKTNKVYASTSETWTGRVQYIFINNFVFSVDYHSGIQQGHLGMNTVQRKLIRASTGDTVTISVYEPPLKGFGISLLKGELEVVSKTKLRPGSALEVDSLDLSKHILNRFSDQVLSNRQQFMFEHTGTNYLLSVVEITVQDKTGAQVISTMGQITDKTAFFFDAPPGSGVSMRGQKLAAPQLFKTKDINFESLGIGGLDKQFDEIFRRAFQSRALPPSLAERMGIVHVKGMLLFGPPGTGKTLIARQIGKMLNAKEPKVVNGPEILNKYVGASEENVRELFKDAEKEQQEKGDASALHVIIMDEIDAICKQRGSVGSGTGVHDTVVNQLLTKIDGVDSLNNILLIGMTNRKDMLDDALLRPGRLEVQVEIGLPDEGGRHQILKIHTDKMSRNSFIDTSVDLIELAARTKNFSGAEIQGLVKSAQSFALSRQMDMGNLSGPIDEDNLKVTMADFESALAEVKPAFGAVTDTLEAYRPGGIIKSGARLQHLMRTCQDLVTRISASQNQSLFTMLLEGPQGSGKTAIAATLGLESEFPFVKVISSQNMMGYTESAKVAVVTRTIEDAYRSPSSLVIIDEIERIIEYIPIGPRFSNTLTQIVLELLKKQPPKGHKLMVIGTTSSASVMEDLGVIKAFKQVFHVPLLKEQEIRQVLAETNCFRADEVEMAVASLLEPEISIQRLLDLLDLARDTGQRSTYISIPRWQQVLRDLQAS